MSNQDDSSPESESNGESDNQDIGDLNGMDYNHTPSSAKHKKRKYSGGKLSPLPATLNMAALSTLLDNKLEKHISPLKTQIETLKESMPFKKCVEFEGRIKVLEKENKVLRDRVNQQDSFSRRNNIRFYGAKENSYEDCESVIMGITKDANLSFDSRTFERVHRLGKKSEGIDRPIICKFLHFKDKLALLNKRDVLNKMNIQISDDYCKDVEASRRKLLPILKEGKKIGENIKLIGDKIILNGKFYSTDDVHKLPEPLKPENISTRTQNGLTCFFTKDSPLSNFHACEFTVDKEKFNCSEQFYMVNKAREFKDKVAEKKILSTNNPGYMKSVGDAISGFKRHVWAIKAEDIMYKGLCAKFSQSPRLGKFLLETGDNLLCEASENTVWGVGLTLQNPRIWNIDNHTGQNKLGKVLMRVRSTNNLGK